MIEFDGVTKRYLSLLEALGQAVIATDVGGSILFWNSVAESLYGFLSRHVIGCNILEVTPSSVSRSQAVEIMEVLAGGGVWSGEFLVHPREAPEFLASVTDVPLLGDQAEVVGIIGVSGRSSNPTQIGPFLSLFVDSCETIWPGQLALQNKSKLDASVGASEPHLAQLLALLLLPYTDALDRGAGLELALGRTDHSPFVDFGLARSSSGIYLKISRKQDRPTFTVLRSLSGTADPVRFASALVRMVGGMLIAGAAPDQLNELHLSLPVVALPGS